MIRGSWPRGALLALFALFALLAAGQVAAAPAQAVWRCGPDGRSFSDRPCADGSAVDAHRRPTSEAVSEARAVAAREREALRQLAQERRQRHADAARAGLAPAGIHSAPAVAGDRDAAAGRQTRSRGPQGPQGPKWREGSTETKPLKPLKPSK